MPNLRLLRGYFRLGDYPPSANKQCVLHSAFETGAYQIAMQTEFRVGFQAGFRYFIVDLLVGAVSVLVGAVFVILGWTRVLRPNRETQEMPSLSTVSAALNVSTNLQAGARPVKALRVFTAAILINLLMLYWLYGPGLDWLGAGRGANSFTLFVPFLLSFGLVILSMVLAVPESSVPVIMGSGIVGALHILGILILLFGE